MLNLAHLFRHCLNADYIQVENDASFAVFTENQALHILFESSKGDTDWKNNLDFPAVPYRKMEDRWLCHRGFLRVWKSAEPYIAQILEQTKSSCIIVAGYSHGGALAALCHEYIWFHYPHRRRDLHGVGFGCPRVLWCFSGCAALAQRWENFLTIRNLDDAVTHLPPRILGYKHVGTILEIGKKGRYSPVKAHFAENYLDSLEEHEALRDIAFQSPV